MYEEQIRVLSGQNDRLEGEIQDLRLTIPEITRQRDKLILSNSSLEK